MRILITLVEILIGISGLYVLVLIWLISSKFLDVYRAFSSWERSSKADVRDPPRRHRHRFDSAHGTQRLPNGRIRIKCRGWRCEEWLELEKK